jgi:uncharacterized tellurite resistance protein B-like protein
MTGDLMPTREHCLLSALAEVAWADGVLKPQEAQFFVDVITQLALPADAAAALYRDILATDAPASLDPIHVDEDDRRWILGFGHLMSACDGEVSPSEVDVLRSLARRLGVSWEEAQALFKQADTIRPLVIPAKGNRP